MNKIYYLEGTPNELQCILENQFNMEKEMAKLYICLMLMDQQSVDKTNNDEVALWYLHDNDSFTTPIGKTRFVVSFSDFKKELFEQLAIPIIGIIFDRDSFSFSLIAACLIALYKSSTHINKDECCVYYQSLLWKSLHPSELYFCIEDILPETVDGFCCHLDEIRENKWRCDFCKNERCNANTEKYKHILDELCQKNVFIPCGKLYRFKK